MHSDETRPHMLGNPDDAELEDELRRVADRLDPVPPGVLASAVAGFAWRTIDAELAELEFDSLAAAGGGAALVRGTRQPRSLSFRAQGLSIDLEITGPPDSCALVGQLTPAQAATLEIRHRNGAVSSEADELGRFSARPLPAGPLSLRCRFGTGAGQRAVVTDWISI
jgi:hypothetical protein